MGSYRIEESPNKRAGCNVKACKDHKIKIQKGELRLGTWVDTERYQSWTYRHWGCVTVKVLANILEAISEDGEPDFDMLDGFEELSTENQAKVKEAVLKGELDEADKTDHSHLNGDADSDAQGEPSSSAKKAKTGTKAKAQKRSRAESDAEEEAPSRTTKKAKAAGKEKTNAEKPAKRGKARIDLTHESSEEDEVPAERTQKAKGRVVTKEKPSNEKPAKRSTKKAAAMIDDEVAVEGENTEAQPVKKRGRGEAAAATGEKPKRGRKKKVVDDEE